MQLHFWVLTGATCSTRVLIYQTASAYTHFTVLRLTEKLTREIGFPTYFNKNTLNTYKNNKKDIKIHKIYKIKPKMQNQNLGPARPPGPNFDFAFFVLFYMFYVFYLFLIVLMCIFCLFIKMCRKSYLSRQLFQQQ